jgi:hypothetical protein
MALSKESGDVDSDSHVQLTVNDSVNITNFYSILVSGAAAIDKKQTVSITHGGSGAPDNWNPVCRIRCPNSTQTIYNEDDM